LCWRRRRRFAPLNTDAFCDERNYKGVGVGGGGVEEI